MNGVHVYRTLGKLSSRVRREPAYKNYEHTRCHFLFTDGHRYLGAVNKEKLASFVSQNKGRGGGNPYNSEAEKSDAEHRRLKTKTHTHTCTCTCTTTHARSRVHVQRRKLLHITLCVILNASACLCYRSHENNQEHIHDNRSEKRKV